MNMEYNLTWLINPDRLKSSRQCLVFFKMKPVFVYGGRGNTLQRRLSYCTLNTRQIMACKCCSIVVCK